MYRVLLADDEEHVLKTLKTSIDWQALGIGTVETADDGVQALEAMEQAPFDLLITDIKMPRMDGLALIRQVRCLYPETRCVLLTAYGEFEYAKEAIKLGVENYLLKPVAKDEVEQTIRNAMDNLYHHRRNGDDLLRQNILRRWLCGTIAGEELSERAIVLGLNLYLPQYCALCMVKKRKEASIAFFRSACIEALAARYDVYQCWDEKGYFALVLGGRDLDRTQIEQRIGQLAQSQQLEKDVSVAVGEIVNDAETVHLSYASACEAVELSDLARAGVILAVQSAAQGQDAELLTEELRMLLYITDEKKLEKKFRTFGTRLYQNADRQHTGHALEQLLYAFIRVMTTEFPDLDGVQQRVSRKFSSIPSQQERADFLDTAACILVGMREIFCQEMDRRSPIIQVALRYIHQGVLNGEGVSIKEFCAKNGMNPAYLGHLFKEETGNFFNDYLTQCRLNRSVLLLKNSNYKVKDIAQEVGFASTSYYVKCFRESKGVSPARYRMEREG